MILWRDVGELMVEGGEKVSGGELNMMNYSVCVCNVCDNYLNDLARA